MVSNILEMNNITKEFPGVIALKGVNFSCREGEVHALMGENGAGKSTLIKLLSGASTPTSGSISFKGKEFKPETPMAAMELGIAIIYQELNLINNLNAYENIFMGREPKKGPFHDFAKMRREAQALMESLDVEIDLNTPISNLSVAQRQMIEIAKALSINASLIVMDEPTSSLTACEIEALYKTIRMLKDKGVTVIYISHHLDEIFEICDRVTVLKDGEYVGVYDIGNLTEDRLINLMVGRDLAEIFPPKGQKRGEKVLEIKNLCHENILKNISLEVFSGEILGIAGLMGAGRTELAESIFGVRKITSGEITYHGKPLKKMTPKIAMENGIGFLTEDRKMQGLVLGMTVKENISLGQVSKISKLGFIDRTQDSALSNEYINSLRIKTPNMDAKVVNLSGGNQQKVVLGKWLACKSKIFILDEPTRGIDVGAKMEIYNLMRQLADDGNAIIMISSELPEVIGMSDRVLVMRLGEITGELHHSEFSEEKIMTFAMGSLTCPIEAS